MPLLIHATTATAAIAPFCIHSPSLLLLSSPLPGDTPCASSTEQRKPKTRRILLKGVSKQPDINNLHVYRAESKPLGICGFTWVCECGSLCVPAFTPSIEHTSSCILSLICAIKHSLFDVIPNQLIVAILNKTFRDVFLSHIFLISRQRAFLSFSAHTHG